MKGRRRQSWILDASFRRTTGQLIRETLIILFLLLASMVIHLAVGFYQIMTTIHAGHGPAFVRAEADPAASPSAPIERRTPGLPAAKATQGREPEPAASAAQPIEKDARPAGEAAPTGVTAP